MGGQRSLFDKTQKTITRSLLKSNPKPKQNPPIRKPIRKRSPSKIYFDNVRHVKYLILENIRSAHNVGSIFRTADGAGVEKIFLVGHTPAPIDRFGRIQAEITKTSLGASATMPWEKSDSIIDTIGNLQNKGIKVVAVEQAIGSISLSNFVTPSKVAFVVGNEITGVSREALDLADSIVEITMRGHKESLNVSVATGIVLFHDVD
jgi:23S rRNA (guanosine2251-2'-O)-methyltransferase